MVRAVRARARAVDVWSSSRGVGGADAWTAPDGRDSRARGDRGRRALDARATREGGGARAGRWR